MTISAGKERINITISSDLLKEFDDVRNKLGFINRSRLVIKLIQDYLESNPIEREIERRKIDAKEKLDNKITNINNEIETLKNQIEELNREKEQYA